MPVDRYLNTGSNYVHPNESNLLNVHKAMEYDGIGRPSLRTILNTTTVQITGPVSILSTVTVNSSPGDPVHVHLTEVGTFGTLTNFVPIQGVVTATVSGTVSVSNFPTTSTVYQGTDPWRITGTVQVSNTVSVSGNITVTDPITIGGTVIVEPADESRTAFDEPIAIEITPVIQNDATYGLLPDQIVLLQSGTATAGVDPLTCMFYASSGITAGSAGSVLSRRFLRYRPGQGSMTRFTARFTCVSTGTGIDGATQFAGFSTIGQQYSFGFSGSAVAGERGVGILHSYNGSPEIRKLTITTGAGGIQTATVTLNSVAYTVSLTGPETATETAAQLAYVINTYGGIWQVDQVGNTISFVARTAAPRSGTYSFSSTGAGTPAAGTFTTTLSGVSATRVWTYKANWNGTPVTFDPTMLNVFAIDYRWLGAGIVRFFMENPSNGKMTLVHTQNWANTSLQPHVMVPSFKIGFAAATLPAGPTPSTTATVYGASMMGAIQGPIGQTTYSKSWYSVNSTTRAQNNLWHLLSVKNPFHKVSKLNSQELIIQDFAVSTQGNDPCVIFLFVNGVPSIPLVWQQLSDSYALYSNTDDAIFNPDTDTPAATFTLGVNGTQQFDLMPYRLTLAPGDWLSIGILSTGNLSRTAVAITWAPD